MPRFAQNVALALLAVGSSLWAGTSPAWGGECEDPTGACAGQVCEAEKACFRSADCPAGELCFPDNLPWRCVCDEADGEWRCSFDRFAGRCTPDPKRPNPPRYVIIELGTLGGLSSAGLAINNDGVVVGSADTVKGVRHAYIWEAGRMADLGTLVGHRLSEAWDVNNFNQAVGISGVNIEPWTAVLWDGGTVIDLGSLGGSTEAFAINDSMQVVGYSQLSSILRHPFLWQKGVMTDLRTEGFEATFARDINVHGAIVGGSCLWEAGVVTDLGTLGGNGSAAQGVNDHRLVVGSSEKVPGELIPHAFLWEDGMMTDLGAVGGFEQSRAEAINNAGQVVGSPHFLYDRETRMHDLHLLVPPDGRWYQLELDPRDINDAGQIVGIGTFSGARRAFLMTPVNGDFDDDGDTDLIDLDELHSCWRGPGAERESCCELQDIDRDGHVDLRDARAWQWLFTGP